jgi:hypothetical protein
MRQAHRGAGLEGAQPGQPARGPAGVAAHAGRDGFPAHTGAGGRKAQLGRPARGPAGVAAHTGREGFPAHAGAGGRKAQPGTAVPAHAGERAYRPSRITESRPSRGEKSWPSQVKAYSSLGLVNPAWAWLIRPGLG